MAEALKGSDVSEGSSPTRRNSGSRKRTASDSLPKKTRLTNSVGGMSTDEEGDDEFIATGIRAGASIPQYITTSPKRKSSTQRHASGGRATRKPRNATATASQGSLTQRPIQSGSGSLDFEIPSGSYSDRSDQTSSAPAAGTESKEEGFNSTASSPTVPSPKKANSTSKKSGSFSEEVAALNER